MERFTHKVAVVSGGADGCGRAMAVRLAREGARVAILDVNAECGERTVQQIRAAKGEALFLRADASDRSQVRAAVGSALDAFGRIDLLFNHAGTVTVRPFLETSEDEWNRLMAINVNSMFHTCQTVVPHMLEQGAGAIVNTASVSGLTASALEAAYCVSKGACIQLTRAVAVEFRDRGVRCNAVCPALIRTAHGEREAEALVAHGESWSEADVARMQGRICEPEEVAAAALFLASDDASFINGEMLVVDNAQPATT